MQITSFFVFTISVAPTHTSYPSRNDHAPF
jgi:hypothetical protein